MIPGIAFLWAGSYLFATFLPRRERRVLALGLALGVGAIVGTTAFVGTALNVIDAILI